MTGFLEISWFVWAGVAVVLAGLFTVVQIPKQTPKTTGFTHLALRWFHSLAWLLLAISFFVRGAESDLATLADVIGLAGLVTYIAFRVEMSRTKGLVH